MVNKEIFDKTLEAMLQSVASDAEDKIVDDILKNIDDNEHVEFSKEHEKRMQKIFKGERKKILFKRMVVYSKRAAIFLLVTITISGISVFSVKAWRIKFLNFIIETNPSYSEIKFKDVNDSNSYKSNEVSFGYIPDGYTLEESNVMTSSVSLEFANDKNYFRFSTHNINSTMQIDTENSTIKTILINGIEAMYSTNANINILLWHDDNYAYTLTGNITEKEMILIAENIFFDK